jgi:hypothetical protein
MLIKLRHRRLIRLRWPEEDTRFGESQVEILPTLARAIPFENADAWEQQASLYRTPAEETTAPEAPSTAREEP